MASLDNLAEGLSDFGITFNQARIYITAAQLGIASVRQISKKSNIPREEVYRLLPKLQELGLIEKTVERPIRVKATPVEAALSILIKREHDTISERISKLKAKKEEFLIDLQTLKLTREPKDTTMVTLISQKDAIIQKILSMLDAAERTIDIVISRDQLIHFFASYSSLIKKALNRGLDFRVVLEKVDYDDSIISFMKKCKSPRVSFSVRFVNQKINHYFIVDHREALVATSRELTALGNTPCLWTNHNNLIDLIVKDFEIMWLTSQDIETMKSEDVNKRLVRILDSFAPTDHLLLIYRSMEAKYNVLSSFLRIGLKNGESVAYIVPEENLGQTKDILQRIGIDVEKDEKTGAIRILGDNEFYLKNRKFCMQNTRGLIEKMYDDALKRGFEGLRIFGEMDCFFHYNQTSELIEYEKTLHRILDVPIIGMCAYDANLIEKACNSLDLYNELLKAHGNILFTEQDEKMGRLEIRQACTI